MIPVLICGGFGTKLWPLSRKNKPKHFLPLIGGKSLFRLNYQALRTHFKPEEIFVSTNGDQIKQAREQAPGIPAENYIIEPEMRNQGPATGLIAAFLYKKGLEDEPFMIVQTDVVREPAVDFIKMMLDSGEVAKKEEKYITGGKKPNYPVMGVDYLMRGEKVSEEGSVGIYKVDKFIWRSTKEQTERLIIKEGALVHTNHTCMTPRNLLKMLKKYKPEWYDPLTNYINGADINEEYSKMPIGPIEDVTEQAHKDGDSLVVELPFEWYDIGTYEALHKYLSIHDMHKPTKNIIDLDGKGNFVKTHNDSKVVALVGVENLAVVDTNDALLIVPMHKSQDVKQIVEHLKKKKKIKYL